MGSLFGIPGMLWWGIGISVPILIHLFARQRYQRVPWAAMDFLLRAFKKLRRRIRLEQLLLLALRILAILAFVLALARPLLNSTGLLGGNDARREVVLLVDNSFSMGLKAADGSTPFLRAREAAVSILKNLRSDRGDTVTLITTGRPPRTLLSASDDLNRARAELDQLELSDSATDLMGGLQTAYALAQDLPEGAEVFLLSDLQRTGLLRPAPATPASAQDPLAKPEALLSSVLEGLRAKKATINILLPGEVADQDNLAIVAIEPKDRALVMGSPTSVQVTVKNFGRNALRGRVRLFADGSTTAVGQEELEPIAPGQSGVADFRHPFTTPGSHTFEARVESDSLEADNRRGLALEIVQRLRVLIVDGDPKPDAGESESFFLASALDPGGESSRSVFEVETVEETRFDLADLRTKDLVVLMNLGLVSRQRAQDLREFVADGGGLLVFLGDKVQPATLNSLLWQNGAGCLPAEILEPVGENRDQGLGFAIESPVVEHPALRYFADPAIRNWLGLPPIYKFWRTRVAPGDTSTQVLATFDRRSATVPAPLPALLEKTLGRGRTILFTSGGDQEWGDLVAFPTYVLLTRELAHYLTRRENRFENLEVGQSYQRRLRSFAKEVALSRDGEQIQVLTPLAIEGTSQYEVRTQLLERSGVYRLDLSGVEASGRRELTPIHVAVNVDTSESDLARLSPAEVAALFVGDHIKILTNLEETATSTALGREGRSWWWLLALAMGLLLLETALSQLFGLRTKGESA